MKHTINNLNRFDIIDETTKLIHHGFDQEWYSSRVKRIAGCGPTVASSLTLYLFNTSSKQNKDELLNLQESMWDYVKPTWTGISSIDKFYKMYKHYTDLHNLDVVFKLFNVATNKQKRDIQDFTCFIKDELNKNHPIAFLNKDHGNQKTLESWHWTIIVGYEENDEGLVVDLFDNGKQISLNLTQWFNTTKKGGGCVSVSKKEKKQ